MAYLKIFPIKVTDKKALDYITNPDKTDEKLLVSSFGCSPETADLEFSMTREMTKKNGMDKGDNLAFHLIQSFKPGEVDAETAHRLGQQFADEVLKGKYEYVISTHVDKNHIHNHIIFNAASFVDYHKYVSNKRSYHKICRISNRICHENGLATSMPTGEKGKSYKENMEYHRGTSWKAKLRVAVDKSIWTSINYEEFLQKMQLAGYEVRQGKHLSEAFCRMGIRLCPGTHPSPRGGCGGQRHGWIPVYRQEVAGDPSRHGGGGGGGLHGRPGHHGTGDHGGGGNSPRSGGGAHQGAAI